MSNWGKRKIGSGKYSGNGGGKVEVHGHWFDSKLEAALFQQLKLQEKAGEISELQHQPGTVFLSLARIQYRPDFRFKDNASGEIQYAESKGFPNDKWPLKKKLWEYYGPGKLYIYQGSATNLKLTETIEPRGGKDGGV
jgi:hypothetical protein